MKRLCILVVIVAAANAQTDGYISSALQSFNLRTGQACVGFTYTPSLAEAKRLTPGSQIVWYYGDAKNAEKNPEPDEYKTPAGLGVMHCYDNAVGKTFTVLLVVNDPKHFYINQFKSVLHFNPPMEVEKRY